MSQNVGPIFGNGSDGTLTISSNTTDVPIDSSCSGSSGSTSLSATNVSFVAGQKILIHKSRGDTTTAAGTWEINQIASYTAGTITTSLPLVNSYQDSGADQSQVLVLKQYSSVTVNSGVTLTAKAWDGNVGGILAFLISGTVTVTGSISSSGKGFIGGTRNVNSTGNQGESTTSPGSQTTSANGSGGGGGEFSGSGIPASGGGGGYATAGATAPNSGGSPTHTGGTGGSTVGIADLTTMIFGGAGGAAGDKPESGGVGGTGGNSGGIVMIFSNGITITGSINVNGNNGVNGTTGGGGNAAGGGGGSGGAILIKGKNIDVGSSLLTSTGGAGGSGINNDSQLGGAGGVGRIRVEACSVTGTTNPSASESEGGHAWCGSIASII